MAIDAVRRIMVVTLAATILLAVIGCAVIGAVWSPTIAAYLAGGITLGPCLSLALRDHEVRRRHRVVVVGRDVGVPRR